MNIPETEKKKREQEGAQQELPRAETKVEPPSAPLAAAASEQQTSQHETTSSGPDSGQEKHFAPKKLFGIDYTDNEKIKFLVYLFIGGTAALVEWTFFWIFAHVFGIHYQIATASAFTLSTVYHYFLGNILVFNSGARYRKGKEFSLVLLVSAIGLGLNMLLMEVFVGFMHWHPMLSKMLCSALVVFWNYLSRKKWIF